VGATIPSGILPPHETDVGLMDQSRRLQCLTGSFVPELGASELAKLFINQGQQLVGRLAVAVPYFFQ
jgi:hypothetical protein